jgi:hypothetical protein
LGEKAYLRPALGAADGAAAPCPPADIDPAVEPLEPEDMAGAEAVAPRADGIELAVPVVVGLEFTGLRA